MITQWVLLSTLSIVIPVCAAVTVATSHESSYQSGSTHYILHGDSVTLVCDSGLTKGEVRQLEWLTTNRIFLYYGPQGSSSLENDFIERDVEYEFSGTEHRLTINDVNILTDGIQYSCRVTTAILNQGTDTLDLAGKIWDAPDTVRLSTPGTVIEEIVQNIQCTLTSIFPGKEQTKFRVRVGSDFYSGGSETESPESNGVTYTVTYTHALNFTRKQQGQGLQCEVTWGEGPVEVMKKSNTINLDVNFLATAIQLTPSHTGLLAENTEVTFTCVTDESNPTSNIVWTRDGNIVSTGISVSEESGLYNSNKRRSVLTVTTHRSLNGATYECYVEGRESVSDSTQLQVKRVPQPPHSAVFEVVTAISVTLSWLPGLNGGAEQSFTVYYRHEGDTKILYDAGIQTDEENQRIVHKVLNLLPDTKYFFRIQAQNIYGESDHQPESSTSTLGLPLVRGVPEAKIYEDIVALYWQQIDGDYTRATLVKCSERRENCVLLHNITDVSVSVHVLDTRYDSEEYYLIIYQETDEVITQQFAIVDKTLTPDNKGLIAGLAVTSTLAGLLAISLVSVIMFCRWRRRVKNTMPKENSNPGTRTYANVACKNEASHYEMTKPKEPSPPAEYTDLKPATYEAIH